MLPVDVLLTVYTVQCYMCVYFGSVLCTMLPVDVLLTEYHVQCYM